jgi:DNA gyrase subunit B
MTDADVDGAHIRVLLLTFFYRYQRQLIEDGYVCVSPPTSFFSPPPPPPPPSRSHATSRRYCACPPLYKITSGKKVNYVYTEEEKLAHLESIGPEAAGRASLQRFKGLGEMMPQQLWETTMDPTVRTLKQVTIEDAAESDLVMSTLMGDSVAPRKDFITRNSESVAAGDLDF